MRFFVSGVASRVSKYVNVLNALSDIKVVEDSRYYKDYEFSESAFVVSCIKVSDESFPYAFFEDSELEDICKIVGINFLTSL